jgi:hypothetical protein
MVRHAAGPVGVSQFVERRAGIGNRQLAQQQDLGIQIGRGGARNIDGESAELGQLINAHVCLVGDLGVALAGIEGLFIVGNAAEHAASDEANLVGRLQVQVIVGGCLQPFAVALQPDELVTDATGAGAADTFDHGLGRRGRIREGWRAAD